jgi:hypothetical protein
MSAFPSFSEIRFKAKRQRVTIEAVVMLANDDLALVRFGPRGGHKIIKRYA